MGSAGDAPRSQAGVQKLSHSQSDIDLLFHQIDVAIVWGPFAGYFVKQEPIALDVVPVSPTMFLSIPFSYGISAGVRKGNDALRAEVDHVLETESATVQQILVEYGVVQVQ